MIFFFPDQPYCWIIPKYLLSWAYTTWNELGVLALFLAETCHRIFHHHRLQLALIGTLRSSRMERSVMEWAGRTNYPSTSGMNLLVLCGADLFLPSLLGLGGGLRRYLFSEAVKWEYWGRSVHWVSKTKLLSYDHWTAINRSPHIHPILPHPFYLSFTFAFFL